MISINWKSVEKQIDNYGCNPPFDYVVIDDFFTLDFAMILSNEFPKFESQIWLRYNNPIEIKKVCNDWNVFPENTYSTFAYFNSQPWLDFLSTKLLGGKTLYADSGLNGGGWHIHKKGGKLNTHLDYSLHPKLRLQRKLNIIIYMNPNWQESWGGALGLWNNESSERPGELVVSIWNKFNRAVIFDTTQNSWHGLPEPLRCPENEFRQSLAAYFLCEAPEDIDTRGKALFSPTKEQENDKEVIELIKKRSNVKTASSVYDKS
ncbi:2OG-Fe(II) oxygenase [Paracoccaceae bacterium]|nr:2OG-Fe(II) oxygenase [Paracoccaceae bacterium]